LIGVAKKMASRCAVIFFPDMCYDHLMAGTDFYEAGGQAAVLRSLGASHGRAQDEQTRSWGAIKGIRHKSHHLLRQQWHEYFAKWYLKFQSLCFDTNRTIRKTFFAAGYPDAEANFHIRRSG
jgi:hypothetical protein